MGLNTCNTTDRTIVRYSYPSYCSWTTTYYPWRYVSSPSYHSWTTTTWY